MAYDQGLAHRIREIVDGRQGVSEKAMFGGVAFLLDGKMFVGIVKDELMVRVGPDAHDQAITEPYARTMDFTGRPMRGYVFVKPPGFEDDRTLTRWIDRAAAHVATLPAPRGAKMSAPPKAPAAAKKTPVAKKAPAGAKKALADAKKAPAAAKKAPADAKKAPAAAKKAPADAKKAPADARKSKPATRSRH